MFGVGELENNPPPRQAMVDQLRAFVAAIDARDYASFEHEVHIFEGEDHNSVFPAAFTRGLRTLIP